MILRTAASMTSTPLRRMDMPSLSRKGADMMVLPRRALQNYRADAAALDAREAWRMAGHDHATATELVNLGRRFTSPVVVAFAALSADYYERAAMPLEKKSVRQSASVDIWALQEKPVLSPTRSIPEVK